MSADAEPAGGQQAQHLQLTVAHWLDQARDDRVARPCARAGDRRVLLEGAHQPAEAPDQDAAGGALADPLGRDQPTEQGAIGVPSSAKIRT
jgi:hypothetical protein